ncbi:MAG: LrgB family protein, partial [Lachnospiraceae bacterium]|nr:LrgB family protein [Lachnospiraceae bacterium]
SSSLLNPMLISIVITIAILCLFNVNYETYNKGAKYLTYLLTPATVCLAIPLYEQFQLLKKNWKAVMLGILSGVFTNALVILSMVILFDLKHEDYVTLLPKSITTAIGIDVSNELGGYVAITVAAICITGVFGNVIGETVLRLFRIEEPIAKGVGLGTASHAIGTSKALEIGEVEGAMGSLSIVVTGILTVLLAPLFAQLW